MMVSKYTCSAIVDDEEQVIPAAATSNGGTQREWDNNKRMKP